MDSHKSVWKQLLHRKAACAALIVILAACFMAVFAHVLATDKSSNANTMMVELGGRPMGFTKQFLRVPQHHQPAPEGFFSHFWNGTPDAGNYVPINRYRIKGDSIFVQHYIDDGIADTLGYSLAELSPDGSFSIDKSIVSKRFYLGTDRYGRDIYSRLLLGGRISLAVGIVSVVMSLLIGLLLGGLAGWYGGIVDEFIMWIINILWAIPTVLLVFAITLTIGKGFWEIFIAIGLTSWVGAARLIRGQVIQLRTMAFITAARALGYSDIRILLKHILPNIAGPIMVIAAANFAAAILTEAGLSFLGVGVQPPTPSWGLMIKEHYNFLIAGNPLPAIVPGLAIMVLVLAFNILGNTLSDILNVRNQH